MAAHPLNALVRHIRRMAGENEPAPASDAQLLARYVGSRDEEAFAEIVQRHGPLVWAICRSNLSAADADDAFQATFLVLARKAGRFANLARWRAGYPASPGERCKALVPAPCAGAKSRWRMIPSAGNRRKSRPTNEPPWPLSWRVCRTLRLEVFQAGARGGALNVLLEALGRVYNSEIALSDNKENAVAAAKRAAQLSQAITAVNTVRQNVGQIALQDVLESRYVMLGYLAKFSKAQAAMEK